MRVSVAGVVVVGLAFAARAEVVPVTSSVFAAPGGAVVCEERTGGGGPPTVSCQVPARRLYGGIDSAGEPYSGRLRGGEPAPVPTSTIRPGERSPLGFCVGVPGGVRCDGQRRQSVRITAGAVRVQRPESPADCGTIRGRARHVLAVRRVNGSIPCRRARLAARYAVREDVRGVPFLGEAFLGGWTVNGDAVTGFGLHRGFSDFVVEPRGRRGAPSGRAMTG